MQEEIYEFERLHVWELVPPPDCAMVIALKWIYKVKLDEYGDVLKNKESQLEGFVDPDHPHHVYRLKKALYDLKQAPRAWYGTLSKFLLGKGFSKGVVDPTLFIRRTGKHILHVQIYVNDIIFASTDSGDCDRFSNEMSSKFQMSMMGQMSFFLDKCDPVDTPMMEHSKLDEDHSSCTVRTSVAITFACNNVHHSRSKHIDIRHHFIREQVEKGVVELYFVRTKYQLADIFTKALPRVRFEFIRPRLGMRSLMPETPKVF
ncbi:retrovirus-related pol polyprotein from transposon TNT 1-94 [Tanacetum coccineum]|uniref:Retrovirus-related pol polyprotein from transposon TNT 1-94 n=1 Tax=Tanacetum coccineum TaxID=301880 RepID=A0ABQ5IK01_9ASTR